MIVFDVIVDGRIRETIHPQSVKLREMTSFINQQMKALGRKYGYGVQIKRRMVY